MRNQGGRKKPTQRRIEPKSTFGIYIPADTPAEVCDFLNVLKDSGNYSNDVVEILIQYLELRLFLNPDDPLDGVHGNLLDEIKTRLQTSEGVLPVVPGTLASAVEQVELKQQTAQQLEQQRVQQVQIEVEQPIIQRQEQQIEQIELNHAVPIEHHRQGKAIEAAESDSIGASSVGFDLNKVLQRMKRNKQLGSVNQLKS